MSYRRKLNDLIEQVPEQYIEHLYEIVKDFKDNDYELVVSGEVVPSRNEKANIQKAKDEFKKGEYYTFEEIFDEGEEK